jgi:hypothetical protein
METGIYLRNVTPGIQRQNDTCHRAAHFNSAGYITGKGVPGQ